MWDWAMSNTWIDIVSIIILHFPLIFPPQRKSRDSKYSISFFFNAPHVKKGEILLPIITFHFNLFQSSYLWENMLCVLFRWNLKKSDYFILDTFDFFLKRNKKKVNF